MATGTKKTGTPPPPAPTPSTAPVTCNPTAQQLAFFAARGIPAAVVKEMSPQGLADNYMRMLSMSLADASEKAKDMIRQTTYR